MPSIGNISNFLNELWLTGNTAGRRICPPKCPRSGAAVLVKTLRLHESREAFCRKLDLFCPGWRYSAQEDRDRVRVLFVVKVILKMTFLND